MNEATARRDEDDNDERADPRRCRVIVCDAPLTLTMPLPRRLTEKAAALYCKALANFVWCSEREGKRSVKGGARTDVRRKSLSLATA
jgi:hypothetical protein